MTDPDRKRLRELSEIGNAIALAPAELLSLLDALDRAEAERDAARRQALLDAAAIVSRHASFPEHAATNEHAGRLQIKRYEFGASLLRHAEREIRETAEGGKRDGRE